MSTLIFECAGISDGGRFPRRFTGRGKDVSPEIRIRNLSSDVQTLAVILEDISHPLFSGFTHWLLWDFPAAERIPGAVPAGKRLPEFENARQGFGYGMFRYAGPKPPKGQTHTYRFTVCGLDGAIGRMLLPTKSRFLKKAQGHILQMGQMEFEFE